MMIINNVLLKLKDNEAGSIQKAQAVLLGMKGKIEGLVDIQAELNIRPGSSSYDILLITKFATMEDFEAYLTHPAHLEVGRYIVGVLDAQASVCYAV